MYQRTKITIDWTVALIIYSLVLLIIPISDKFLIHLNADKVNLTLNLIISSLISLVFICLLVYLIKKDRNPSVKPYIWLMVSFVISIYFLIKVKITSDRLHFLGYGILSLFLYRAIRHNIGTIMLYLWSGLLVMFFAILDETIQTFGLGGRSFELKDICIDWLSSLLGQGIIALVVRPKLELANITIRRYVKRLNRINAFKVKHVITQHR